MYNYTRRIPLLLSPLADSPLSPLCSPFDPLLLTCNPPSCDRIHPPRSQVAWKLTSPVPTLYPNPPLSKFPEPQLPSASLRWPQESSGVFCPEQWQSNPAGVGLSDHTQSWSKRSLWQSDPRTIWSILCSAWGGGGSADHDTPMALLKKTALCHLKALHQCMGQPGASLT